MGMMLGFRDLKRYEKAALFLLDKLNTLCLKKNGLLRVI